MRLIFAALAVSSLSAAAYGAGQDVAPKTQPPVVEKLFDCRAIEDPDARLACFDREIDNVMRAQQNEDLVIADRAQLKETRKGLFGFTLPRIGLFGDQKDEDEIKEVIATIASAREMPNGRYSFELADGARWLQSDNTPILLAISSGEQVVISKASMGSYLAKVGKRRAFRVTRVN